MKYLSLLCLLFVPLLSFHKQTPAYVNPPGVTVRAWQYSIYDNTGSGSVVDVELLNANGLSAAFTDTNGATWPAAVLTLGAHAAESVGYGITQYAPDSTHTLVAPTPNTADGQYLMLRVVSGQITVNASGTYDCSSGAAGGSSNGIMPGLVAPNSTSPTLIYQGDVWILPIKRS